MEILLDGALISSGGRLLIEGMSSKRREMGVFSELRMAIVLGAVAMLYVAIGSLLRLIPLRGFLWFAIGGQFTKLASTPDVAETESRNHLRSSTEVKGI
jgi:hypothetical protein